MDGLENSQAGGGPERNPAGHKAAVHHRHLQRKSKPDWIDFRCKLRSAPHFFSSRRRHTILQGEWSSDVCSSDLEVFIFFFQAEDGIRDYKVTGVQTCALPI